MAFDYTNFLDNDTAIEADFRFTNRAGTVQPAGSGLAVTNTAGEWCLGVNSTASTGTGPSANPPGRAGFVYTETSSPAISSVWAIKRNISFNNNTQNVFLDIKHNLNILVTAAYYVEYAIVASPNETTDWTILTTVQGTATDAWLDRTFDFSAVPKTSTLWIRIRFNTPTSDFVNDIAFSTWREYGVDSAGISTVTPSEFDYDNANVVIAGLNFGATQGAGKVYISDAATLAGSANEVDVSAAIVSWATGSVSLNLNNLNSTAKNSLSTLGPSASRWVILTNNSAQEYSKQVTTHRAKAFILAASAHIAASGANTTAQLIAPSGKTTANFGGGRIQDDENPSDAIDLTNNQYREDEWCVSASDASNEGSTYQFRVLINGSAQGTISQTPAVTITAAATGGNIKYHDGATFGLKPAKVWLGSSFDTKPAKFWNGATWTTTS